MPALLWHCSAKWPLFPHLLHSFRWAGHCLGPCFCPHLLQSYCFLVPSDLFPGVSLKAPNCLRGPGLCISHVGVTMKYARSNCSQKTNLFIANPKTRAMSQSRSLKYAYTTTTVSFICMAITIQHCKSVESIIITII